jgi:hypothetical protein
VTLRARWVTLRARTGGAAALLIPRVSNTVGSWPSTDGGRGIWLGSMRALEPLARFRSTSPPLPRPGCRPAPPPRGRVSESCALRLVTSLNIAVPQSPREGRSSEVYHESCVPSASSWVRVRGVSLRSAMLRDAARPRAACRRRRSQPSCTDVALREHTAVCSRCTAPTLLRDRGGVIGSLTAPSTRVPASTRQHQLGSSGVPPV